VDEFNTQQLVIHTWHYRARASNVHSAGRYSKIQRSPTSTQRRVDTISSRSPQKRCVIPLHPTSTYDSRKIKPLTEEEKQQKLAELREKMSEKRAKKAAEEAKEAKANELIRRKAGKVRTKTTSPSPQTDDKPTKKKKKNARPLIAHRNQRRSRKI
jgi:hypothetical protein